MSDRGEHPGGGQLIAILGPPFEGSAKFSVKMDEIYSHFSALISLRKTNSDLELASKTNQRLISIKAPVGGGWMAHYNSVYYIYCTLLTHMNE